MHQCFSVSVHQCISASVHQCVSASVHQCITASLHQCNSASVRMYISKEDICFKQHYKCILHILHQNTTFSTSKIIISSDGGMGLNIV